MKEEVLEQKHEPL